MNNNKILSTLLMMTAMTSMVAGAFAVNKNVYNKVDAAVTSYKTVYLYVPNNVTDTSGKNPVTWDAEENNVKIYKSSNEGTGEAKFEVMTKIQDNLYFYTISNEDNIFYFRTTINSKKYYGPSGEAVKKFDYSSLSTSSSMLELQHYGYGGSDLTNVGTWSNPATVLDTASEYANAFIKVLGDDACQLSGNSDFTKIKSVWNGLAAIYEQVPDLEQVKLADADKDDPSDPLKDFAALYDYVYWKYGNYDGFGSDFISRGITPRPVGKYVSSNITDNNVTTNVVVVSSISLVSLSIIGIYFYIRKRKEDK